ncbi:hypothetical protein ENBRE01_2548 [Enteropsectra breve]|nr:hypothetical protein ENBRE01_2548 [Enteropsectra breve]
MANLILLALLCKLLYTMPMSLHARMYANALTVEIDTTSYPGIFDLRDLLKSKVLERAFRGTHVENVQLASMLDLQLKMYELYENARHEIECSVSDTSRIYNERIQEKLMQSGCFEEFVKTRDFAEKLDLSLPLEFDPVYFVFELTTGWCQDLYLYLDDENLAKTLIAFDFLEIDHDKEVDVFYEQNGLPVHLRMKTIHLFCINIVYLLEIQGMLDDYKYILTGGEKRYVDRLLNKPLTWGEESDTNDIAILIKNTGPLAHFICLLQFEMENRHVTSLLLGTESTHFVYDLLYEENCKSVHLKHKNDIEESSTRLDLIVELNTINNPLINRRLEIVLPFVRNYMFKRYSKNVRITSESVMIFNCYMHFMGIFDGLTELTISHFLNYCVFENTYKNLAEYVDTLLLDTVVTAIKQLPGLNALFIRGFDKIPGALVPILRKMQLKKFGAMCSSGAVDYLVIYRLFNTDCLLRKSISHFVGHFRALLFISMFLRTNQIKEAIVTDWIAGPYKKFSDDEQIFVDQIKMNFEDEDLHKPIIFGNALQIDTLYYLETSFLKRDDTLHTFRPFAAPLKAGLFGEIGIYEHEIYNNCMIKHLKLLTKPYNHAFLRSFMMAPENLFHAIETIELIVSDHEYVCFEGIAHYLRHYANKYTVLILNINAHRILLEQTENKLKSFTPRDFYPLIKHLVIDRRLLLKIRLRQKGSGSGIKENIMRSFRECFGDEYENEGLDRCNQLKFETVDYKVDTEASLNSLCL